MRSRRFSKRIKIFQTLPVSDSFGGNTNESELLTETWADIQSINPNKPFSKDLTDFGITNTQLAVIVTVRLRKDLTYNSINQFINYAGNDYVIKSFPENKNFDNRFITFIAAKQDLKFVSEIQPVGPEVIYVNYFNRFIVNGGAETSKNCQTEFISKLI